MQLLRHSYPGHWWSVLVDRTNMHKAQRVTTEEDEQPATLSGEEARDKERTSGKLLVIHKDKKQDAEGAPDPVRLYMSAGVESAAQVRSTVQYHV